MKRRGAELPRTSGVRSPCFAGGSIGSVEAAEAYQQAEVDRSIIRAANTFLVLSADVPLVMFADDLYRAFFELQNRGPGNIFISFGQTPQAPILSYPGTIMITALDYYVRDHNVPVDTIYVVSDTDNTIVTGVQGVWSAT